MVVLKQIKIVSIMEHAFHVLHDAPNAMIIIIWIIIQIVSHINNALHSKIIVLNAIMMVNATTVTHALNVTVK